MRRLLILLILVFGAILLSGYATAQSDTVYQVDTLIQLDTVFQTDTVPRVDTVVQRDTIETSVTNNSERYIKSAFEMVMSNKGWINIMLTVIGILVGIVAAGIVYAAYQGGKARQDAKDEVSRVRAITSILIKQVEDKCEKIDDLTVKAEKRSERIEDIWKDLVKKSRELEDTTEEQQKVKGFSKLNIEEVIKLIPETDAKTAIIKYEKILAWMEIENIPTSEIPVDVLIVMGDRYLTVKDYVKAEKVYKLYLDVEPDELSAMYGLAISLHHQNKYKESLRVWEETATKFQDTFIFTNWASVLITAYHLTNDISYLNQSIEKCEKAVEQEQSFYGAYYNFASTYALKGDKVKMLEYLNRVKDLNVAFLIGNAPKDKDFKAFWDDPDFKEMTKPDDEAKDS